AWRAALRAGDHAASLGASDEALHWYERASQGSPSEQHSLCASERILIAAATGVIHEHAAAPYISRLHGYYEERGCAIGLLRCEYIDVYDNLITRQPTADRVAHLTRIAAEAERLGDPVLAFESLKEAIASALHSSNRSEVVELLMGVRHAGDRHVQLKVPALSFVAIGLVTCGSSTEALACAEEAVRCAEAEQGALSLIRAYAARGAANAAAG